MRRQRGAPCRHCHEEFNARNNQHIRTRQHQCTSAWGYLFWIFQRNLILRAPSSMWCRRRRKKNTFAKLFKSRYKHNCSPEKKKKSRLKESLKCDQVCPCHYSPWCTTPFRPWMIGSKAGLSFGPTCRTLEITEEIRDQINMRENGQLTWTDGGRGAR